MQRRKDEEQNRPSRAHESKLVRGSTYGLRIELVGGERDPQTIQNRDEFNAMKKRVEDTAFLC